MKLGMTTVMLVCGALSSTACGATKPLPNPRGEELSTGIYAFSRGIESPVRKPRRDAAWDATPFNPGLGRNPTTSQHEVSMTPVGPLATTGWLFYRGYKATISRVDGSTCRFEPSCSEFGLQAARRHGIHGVLMTFGRLQRNHSDESRYPMTTPPFLADPVANYDFWFAKPELDDFDAYGDPGHAWSQHLRAVRRLDY